MKNKKLHILITVAITCAVLIAIYLSVSFYKSDDSLVIDDNPILINCALDESDLSSDAYIASLNNKYDFETKDLTEEYGVSCACRTDNGSVCAVIKKSRDKLCFFDNNFNVLKEIPMGDTIACVYKIDNGVIVQGQANTYFVNNLTYEIKPLDFVVPFEVTIYTYKSEIAYKIDDSIYLYDGNERKTIKINEKFDLNGFIDDDKLLLSRERFFGSVIKMSTFSVSKNRITKNNFIRTYSGYVNFLSVNQNDKTALLFSVNDSGYWEIYFLNLNEKKYHEVNIDVEFVKSVQFE